MNNLSLGAISLSFRTDCNDPNSEIFETFYGPVAEPFSLGVGDDFQFVIPDSTGTDNYCGRICKKTHRVVFGNAGSTSWEVYIILDDSYKKRYDF